MPSSILVIQGAQYGSEAKGMVAGALAIRRNSEIAVRTGSVNAGHTVYYGGNRYTMQQIPVAWVNPETQLVIGAGTYVDPKILESECAMIQEATGHDVRHRLMIDKNCGLHTSDHQIAAGAAGRHYLIGATGKGCSEAIVEKIRARGAGYRNFGQSPHCAGYKTLDTSFYLNTMYDKGARIMIEGTQGTLLDLHQGPYPYTTSRMTTAANWIAEAGLSPRLNYEVVHVIRTYPIRVAGPSGPLPNEISWPILIRRMNERLKTKSLPPLISEENLSHWEWACKLASGGFPMPLRGEHSPDGLDMHEWTVQERSDYALAASELHRRALKILEEEEPDAYAALIGVFEMTTVTKKLRRIADISFDDLRKAANIDRPQWATLTFLNYKFPELYGKSSLAGASKDVKEYIERVRQNLHLSILNVTTGPLPEHFVTVY